MQELKELLERIINETDTAMKDEPDETRREYHHGCNATAKAILDFIGPRSNITWDLEGYSRP